jgi:hypothetical protein
MIVPSQLINDLNNKIGKTINFFGADVLIVDDSYNSSDSDSNIVININKNYDDTNGNLNALATYIYSITNSPNSPNNGQVVVGWIDNKFTNLWVSLLAYLAYGDNFYDIDVGNFDDNTDNDSDDTDSDTNSSYNIDKFKSDLAKAVDAINNLPDSVVDNFSKPGVIDMFTKVATDAYNYGNINSDLMTALSAIDIVPMPAQFLYNPSKYASTYTNSTSTFTYDYGDFSSDLMRAVSSIDNVSTPPHIVESFTKAAIAAYENGNFTSDILKAISSIDVTPIPSYILDDPFKYVSTNSTSTTAPTPIASASNSAYNIDKFKSDLVKAVNSINNLPDSVVDNFSKPGVIDMFTTVAIEAYNNGNINSDLMKALSAIDIVPMPAQFLYNPSSYTSSPTSTPAPTTSSYYTDPNAPSYASLANPNYHVSNSDSDSTDSS